LCAFDDQGEVMNRIASTDGKTARLLILAVAMAAGLVLGAVAAATNASAGTTAGVHMDGVGPVFNTTPQDSA
jgi:hypothetical protein